MLFDLLAFLREVRRMPTRRRKANVALTAVATTSNQYFLSVLENITDQSARFLVAYQRSKRLQHTRNMLPRRITREAL